MFFSLTTGGFLPEEMRAEYEASPNGWPEDAVEVSPEDETAIRAALSQRATVTLNADGTWTFTDYIPTAAELLAQANALKSELTALATNQISILTDATDPDVVDVPTDADVQLLILWKKYRQALRVANTSANPVAWPVQPAMASGTNLST